MSLLSSLPLHIAAVGPNGYTVYLSLLYIAGEVEQNVGHGISSGDYTNGEGIELAGQISAAEIIIAGLQASLTSVE